MTDNGSISEAYQRWQDVVYRQAAERNGERSDTDFRTSSIETKPLYTPLDLDGADYGHDIGYPREYPYTRGVQPTMYRGRPWSIRQYAGYGTAEEANEPLKLLLNDGRPGLPVRF